ncbi:Peptidoglycan/xylan/chitin deacetylase, PgdA/CDA1 family [Nakamurella panacisegetis]|uniref:Peptidoglycan/xylan/chitin deacetylase, PgdA/CDA1 family n=1 Tax=Nakamurella panacisegetis TaxID=1090615 RepID=A0A1H0IK81_9ACTN|nr:polysaccharide deacetylase family protein [Nakamurella panacisegetis]SDO31461.1 Peptidoglycan/xylan/chitin deacetylase, PgdA/CDA1 family [Nakamurella panacisegetis]
MADLRRRSGVRTLVESRSWGAGSVIGVRTASPIVVMTFDDGPDPAGTTAVLEALRSTGATATFFVLMTRVRRHPALLSEIVAAGHEVGLHGVDHRALPTFSPNQVFRRCRDGRAELEDILGRRLRWMRPPYGRQTVSTWAAVRASGLTPVLWSSTSWDWKPLLADDERVAKAMSNARPGSILLNHDAHAGLDDGVDDGPEPDVDRGKLVTSLIRAYADRGLTPCSLTAALGSGSLWKAARFTR